MVCKGILSPAGRNCQLWSYHTLLCQERHQGIDTPDVNITTLLNRNMPSICVHFIDIQLPSMAFINPPMSNGWQMTNVVLLELESKIVCMPIATNTFLKFEEVIVESCSSSHSAFEACPTVACWMWWASSVEWSTALPARSHMTLMCQQVVRLETGRICPMIVKYVHGTAPFVGTLVPEFRASIHCRGQ